MSFIRALTECLLCFSLSFSFFRTNLEVEGTTAHPCHSGGQCREGQLGLFSLLATAWLMFNFLFNSDRILWGEKHSIFSFKWKPFEKFRIFTLKWHPGYTRGFQMTEGRKYCSLSFDLCLCWAKGLQTNILGKFNPLKEFRIWWFSTIFGCFQDKMVVAKAVSLLPKWKMPLNTDTLLCWWEDGDAGSCRHNSTHWWNCESLHKTV